MTTLADLRALAEAATPGPWEYHWPDHQGGLWPIEGTGWAIPVVGAASVEPNARYIAECSPEVIKALVAVAEAAEWWGEFMGFLGSPHTDHDQRLLDALDALKAVMA